MLNRYVDVITLREPNSLDELRSMGVTKPEILLTADPALTLRPASETETDSVLLRAGIPPHGRYICFALRRWKGFEERAPLFGAAARYAYNQYGLTPVFVAVEKHLDPGAGQMAAKSALENVEGPLHVGLVNYNVNSPNAQEREKGVIDTLTASGRAEVAATVYSVATPESARAETLTMLARHPEINVLISFNEAVSVGAAQAVSDLGRAEDLWMVAFDSNIKTVDALHTGAVDAMVVQNTYGMGYFSVESAYKLLAGQGNDVARETQTATRIIDRSNIFALDGQKAVFPFE